MHADNGVNGALYLTGNDGTLMSAEAARQLPLHTFQSGPVNSLRGAAKLSGLSGANLSWLQILHVPNLASGIYMHNLI